MARQLKGFEDFNLLGLEKLSGVKNLLGFSAQVDSTCLFYLLKEREIDFDIAIINYQTRAQSKDEVKLAKKLAKKFDKKIFIKNAKLLDSNFECRARDIRFKFFSEIIKKHNYSNLILANQLNDRLEWFLIQITKGSGINSALGFSAVSKYFYKDKFYNIIRPLSNTPRNDIEVFLKQNKIKHFKDKSNKDEKYLRNFFRKKYANSLIKHFKNGILKSFSYMQSEYDALYQSEILNVDSIFVFKKKSDLLNLNNISLCAKRLGYVVSKPQRDEIIKSQFSCIIASKIVIDSSDDFVFITESREKIKHSKAFRENLRVANIPPKIRPFVDSEILLKLKILTN